MHQTSLEAASAFYDTSPGVRVFRLALRTFQRVWPAHGVRLAFRLFGTPLPPRWLQRRKPWDAGWRVERWPFEDASLTVYAQPAAPHGPVVLLLHGWGGHAGQMLALAQALAGQGLRPVLVEMPAHGRSGGSVSNLPQFARAIDYVCATLRQQGHGLRAVVAHSLAANAAAYAASRGLPVERLVLLAPPASPRGYVRLFGHVFGLSEATIAGIQTRIETREGVLLAQFEPDAVGARIRIPTLVVHDREDRINRFADGQAYARSIGGAELLPTDGLGHRKILKDEGVLGRVAAFLAPA